MNVGRAENRAIVLVLRKSRPFSGAENWKRKNVDSYGELLDPPSMTELMHAWNARWLKPALWQSEFVDHVSLLIILVRKLVLHVVV
jgi:hypothetical protein